MEKTVCANSMQTAITLDTQPPAFNARNLAMGTPSVRAQIYVSHTHTRECVNSFDIRPGRTTREFGAANDRMLADGAALRMPRYKAWKGPTRTAVISCAPMPLLRRSET